MATATHGEQMAILSRKSHGGDDIRHIRAARNYQRPLVDHAVVELACLSVSRIVFLDHIATQALPQGLFSRICHGLSPRWRRVRRASAACLRGSSAVVIGLASVDTPIPSADKRAGQVRANSLTTRGDCTGRTPVTVAPTGS